jgi:hypothetical protein
VLGEEPWKEKGKLKPYVKAGDNYPAFLQSSTLFYVDPAHRHCAVGFRVVRVPK